MLQFCRPETYDDVEQPVGCTLHCVGTAAKQEVSVKFTLAAFFTDVHVMYEAQSVIAFHY
jgi:hypothetical protein